MGVAYEARDRRLGRMAALKFVRGGEPKLTMRLLKEARAQSRINHPNICRVFEIGEVAGRPYIAMELVNGRRLDEVSPDLSLYDKVVLTRDVALALHEAHTLGILHRDIKPANILVEVTDDGRLRPVVMDFGLAHQEADEHGLTETAAVMGTPRYMSPEQARGEVRFLDRRSDVYSLGATMYELLSGTPPFQGGKAMDVLWRVLHEEPAPLRTRSPSLPEDLDTIAGKCLRKEPGERYDSARALADDLDRYIRGEPIVGRRPGLARRLRARARKNRALVATLSVAVVAVGVVAAAGLYSRILGRREAVALEEKASLSRELGQDVKELEWFLRTAYLSPLHDVSLEENLVRERMKRIADRGSTVSGAASLVDYTLGRGHLALREDREARLYLDRALAGGLETPELHYARFLALGRLYGHDLGEVRLGGGGTWVERRVGQLDAEYLRPALSSMERSRGARFDSPSYLEAIAAYYRDDHQAALGFARRARAEAPWLYEATQLEADVHTARGIERKTAGDLDGAERELEQAGRLYDDAAATARSDASLYLGSAEAWLQRLELDLRRGAAPDEKLARVEDRCRSAATARPASTLPDTKLANALMLVAQHAAERGSDPRPYVTRGVEAAERALRLDQNDFLAHDMLAALRIAEAEYQLAHGVVPANAIAEAIAHGKRALELEPQHPLAHRSLGAAYRLRGEIESSAGADPSRSLESAVARLNDAMWIDIAGGDAAASLLQAQLVLARHLARAGKDPSSMTPPVDQVLARCLAANPAFGKCYLHAAGLSLVSAEHRLEAGGDIAVPATVARQRLAMAEALPGTPAGDLSGLRAELAQLTAEAAIVARGRQSPESSPPGAPRP